MYFSKNGSVRLIPKREFGPVTSAVGRLTLSNLRNKLIRGLKRYTTDIIDPIIYKTVFHIVFTTRIIKTAIVDALQVDKK